MIGFTLISFFLLAAFIVLSAFLDEGIPTSYSAFSAYWDDGKVNVWSVVTFFVAFLMFPPMVEGGDGSYFQFLGFFAPLYLIVVSLTPKWDIDKRQHRVHVIGTVLCAALALLWLVFVRGHVWVLVGCLAAGCAAGYFTKTLSGSKVFWGEMVMFLSVYVSLLIGG